MADPGPGSERVSAPDEFPADPWRLLRDWLPPNDELVRPTMTVASVTADGRADARTQLLSEFDERGFYLHADANSRKIRQFEGNPNVALVLHLAEQSQQLVVQGVAEPAPAAESAQVYAVRSPYLRQLSYQNTHDFAQLPRATRLALWAEFQSEHPIDELAPPPNWAGYLVRPLRLSFWFGDPDTASVRAEYLRESVDDPGWTLELRAG